MVVALIALAGVFSQHTAANAQEDDDLPPRVGNQYQYCYGGGGGKKSAILKVMTINLRHNVDWWEDRFPLVAEEIVRLRPDIIGIQEMAVGFNQSKALMKLIKEKAGVSKINYSVYEHLKTGGDMLSGEGISVFSRFPIKEKAFTELGNGRIALFTRIEVLPELTVDFYNTHLHNEGGDGVRLPQMQKIIELINSKSGANPVVFTGDMNAAETSKTIGLLTAENHFIDTYKSFHKGKIGADGLTSGIGLARTPVKQAPKNRIDYIFMRVPEKNEMKVIGSEVCFRNHAPDGLYPSDHLGVVTTFEIFY